MEVVATHRNVMTTTDHPEAMAPKLVELTEKKRDVHARMAAVASQVADAKVMRMITEEDVRAFLGNFVENLKSFDRAEVKARLRMLLAKIEVNPADLSTRLHYEYRLQPGFLWRPHGEPPQNPPLSS